MADRSVVYRLRADISGFKAQMATAAASVKDAGNKMTGATKEGEKFRKGLSSVGDAAGKIGLAAAAGVGAAVAAAAKFDKAMSGVEAATHESAANMERLREAALQAGDDTAFSANEAAAGIENLAKAGVATDDILNGGLRGALDLAAAGSLEVADAAEAAATAMTQFGLSGEEVPHVADLLAAAAGKAQGEVSDMNYALAQSGTIAAQLGVSLEETTGTLAAMASSGLLGSDAGTSFKTFLMRLVPQTKEAGDAMESIGFAAFDASGKLKSMEEIAGGLEQGLRGMTDEQKQATLATIFGQDAIRAANIIYEQGAAGIADWTEKVDDSGFAAETAATKLDNLAGDWEKFTGALSTALIGTGEGAQGPLRDLVQGATDAVEAFNKLPDSAKTVAGALAGITAVTGGGLWFGSKVIQGVANTREALQDLGIEAGKAKGALRGISSGLQVAAIIVGLNEVEDALDGAFGRKVDTTDLQRSLAAIGRGETTENVDTLVDSFRDLDVAVFKVIDTASGWVPSWIPALGETDVEKAREEIEKLDQALASMVETGDAEGAARSLDGIMAALDEAGISTEGVKDELDAYALALRNTKPAADVATGAAEAVKDAQDVLAGKAARLEGAITTQNEALKDNRDILDEAREKLQEAREESEGTAEGFFGLGDSVDDAKVSLGGWIRDMEKQAKALREFRENAKDAAKNGLDEGLIASLQEAGPEGALRLEQLANASKEQIGRANEAWKGGREEIRKYVDQTTKVPREKVTELKADVKQAERQIDRLEARLARIKEFDIFVKLHPPRVTASGTEAVSPGFGPQLGYADGGWTGPGGKYQPAGVVHGDEYVFSKEATHGNVAYLDALHRQLRGYANGGLVGASAPISPGVSIDYDRLARAMSTVRPMYGDVHVSDGYGGFKRQLLEDRQRAGIGGL